MTEKPILFSGPMVRALLAGRKTQARRVLRPQPPASLVEYTNLGEMVELPPDDLWKPLRHMREFEGGIGSEDHHRAVEEFFAEDNRTMRCPYGAPGTVLWVRETFKLVPATAYRCSSDDGKPIPHTVSPDGYYWAIYREGWTRSGGGVPWKPSIFMPRWASRITLEVTAVRVERLQEIAEADAKAEGLAIREDLPPDPDAFHPPGSYGYVTGLDPYPQGRIFPTAREAFADGWDRINGKRAPWESSPWVWVLEFRRVSP